MLQLIHRDLPYKVNNALAILMSNCKIANANNGSWQIYSNNTLSNVCDCTIRE